MELADKTMTVGIVVLLGNPVSHIQRRFWTEILSRNLANELKNNMSQIWDQQLLFFMLRRFQQFSSSQIRF